MWSTSASDRRCNTYQQVLAHSSNLTVGTPCLIASKQRGQRHRCGRVTPWPRFIRGIHPLLHLVEERVESTEVFRAGQFAIIDTLLPCVFCVFIFFQHHGRAFVLYVDYAFMVRFLFFS